MHLLYLDYYFNGSINNNFLTREFINGLHEQGIKKITLVKRSKINKLNRYYGVKLVYLKDQYRENLKWFEEPERVNLYVASLNPDVIFVKGLNLPIHFRWLRRYIREETRLIGQNTGEDIWGHQKLWLQQFGLRVVNAFVFDKIQLAGPWLKAAVILPRQPVFEMKLNNTDAGKKLGDICIKIRLQ